MTVFANKLEVSCKAQDNKVIAAFPDVCMTPPENPATPPGVPVPYPNFSFDTDTDKGTGTVKVGDTTVNLKNKSYFTKSSGDEAGAAAKKGVISSKNTGKAYSQAYSMDVKAEGKNITRFSDIQTDNHGSPPNVLPWPKIGQPCPPGSGNPCENEINRVNDSCGSNERVYQACKRAGLDKKVSEREDLTEKDGFTHQSNSAEPRRAKSIAGRTAGNSDLRTNKELQIMSNKAQRDPCLAALACKLPPFGDSNTNNCPCKGQTGHHVIPVSSFFESVKGKTRLEMPHRKTGQNIAYEASKAPVICAEGRSHTTGSHGMVHTEMKAWSQNRIDSGNGAETNFTISGGGPTTLQTAKYSEVRDKAIEAVDDVFPLSNCSPACLKAQLDNYHNNELGIKSSQPLHCADPGRKKTELAAAQSYTQQRKLMLKFNNVMT